MAADLHIHILTDYFGEKDYIAMNRNTMGSYYFDLSRYNYDPDLMDRCFDTPNFWVGSVSWLKAVISNDDSYIPSAVAQIATIVGENFPVIDDGLIQRIVSAMDSPNDTIYSLCDKSELKEWLEKYRGEKVFTISW